MIDNPCWVPDIDQVKQLSFDRLLVQQLTAITCHTKEVKSLSSLAFLFTGPLGSFFSPEQYGYENWVAAEHFVLGEPG